MGISLEVMRQYMPTVSDLVYSKIDIGNASNLHKTVEKPFVKITEGTDTLAFLNNERSATYTYGVESCASIGGLPLIVWGVQNKILSNDVNHIKPDDVFFGPSLDGKVQTQVSGYFYIYNPTESHDNGRVLVARTINFEDFYSVFGIPDFKHGSVVSIVDIAMDQFVQRFMSKKL